MFQRELRKYHPDIVLNIAKEIINRIGEPQDTKEGMDDKEAIILGTVAAKFNIILDGYYSKEQFADLYSKLTSRLQERRKIYLR